MRGWVDSRRCSGKAQAEPTGEVEVPFAIVGGLSFPQGIGFGDKADDVGCVVYMSVIHAELGAEVDFINQQIS